MVSSILISSSFHAPWLKQRLCRPIRQQIRLRYCYVGIDSCVGAKRHRLRAGLQAHAVLSTPSDAPRVSNGAKESHSRRLLRPTRRPRSSNPVRHSSRRQNAVGPRSSADRDGERTYPFGAARRTSLVGGRADCPVLRSRKGWRSATTRPSRPTIRVRTPWPLPCRRHRPGQDHLGPVRRRRPRNGERRRVRSTDFRTRRVV
jgi:hypothetical protein